MKADRIEQIVLVVAGLVAACVLVYLDDRTLAATIAGGALGYMTPRRAVP
jgi:hypothetical protein